MTTLPKRPIALGTTRGRFHHLIGSGALLVTACGSSPSSSAVAHLATTTTQAASSRGGGSPASTVPQADSGPQTGGGLKPAAVPKRAVSSASGRSSGQGQFRHERRQRGPDAGLRGVHAFPWGGELPDPNGQGVIQGSGIDPGSASFQAADKDCQAPLAQRRPTLGGSAGERPWRRRSTTRSACVPMASPISPTPSPNPEAGSGSVSTPVPAATSTRKTPVPGGSKGVPGHHGRAFWCWSGEVGRLNGHQAPRGPAARKAEPYEVPLPRKSLRTQRCSPGRARVFPYSSLIEEEEIFPSVAPEPCHRNSPRRALAAGLGTLVALSVSLSLPPPAVAGSPTVRERGGQPGHHDQHGGQRARCRAGAGEAR